MVKLLYPLGILLTGVLLATLPWDFFPLCLSQFIGDSSADNCRACKDIARLLGGVSIFCGLMVLFTTNEKIISSALFTAGFLAVGIFFVFLAWPKAFARPCRVAALPLTFSTAGFQFLLAMGGFLTSREKMSRNRITEQKEA